MTPAKAANETTMQVARRHSFPHVAAGGVVGALVLLGFVGLALQAMENV